MSKALEQLRSELEFVRLRDTARRNHTDPRCYGASSDALAAFALGWGPRPTIPGRPSHHSEYQSVWSGDEAGKDYPHDQADLKACELTFNMAPRHLQDRMMPVLIDFQRYVLERRNRYDEPLTPSTR